MKGRKFKKRQKRRSGKKSVSNFKKSNISTMTISKRSRQQQMVLANRLRTVFTCNFQGTLTGLNSAGWGYVPIYFSYPVTPFSISSGFTMAGNGFATIANLSPGGLKSFMSGEDTGLFNRGKVYAVSVRLTTTPQTQADTVNVCICPYKSASGQRFQSIQSQADAPNASNVKQCTFSNNIRENTIKWYGTACQINGVKKSAIYDDEEYDFSYTVAPANLILLSLMFQKSIAAVNADPIMINMEVKYYVELLEPCQGGQPDVYGSPNEPGATGFTEL